MSAFRTWRDKLTVQGWLSLVWAIMGTVVLAGGTAGAVLLDRSDRVSRELVDGIQPARAAAFQLHGALSEQEMAVRGYLITMDSRFLTSYQQSRSTEALAAQTIRDRLGSDGEVLHTLDDIERSAEQWRSRYAQQAMNTAPTGAQLDTRQMTESGEAQFATLRGHFDELFGQLTAARNNGLANLATAEAWRDRLFAATGAAFAVTALVLAIVVRNVVGRPLSALAAGCRRIVKGSFGQQIEPSGPSDIRAIGTDVDDMRRRLVEELEASADAHARLDQQADELRRSNAELEQFAYVASHDLQEPLRKVASFCQLLERRYGDQLDETGLQYLGFAVDGAKRMQCLISDLLTFSRVGRLGIGHARVDLDTALNAALSNLETAIEESGAQLSRPTHLPAVIGDPTLLTMLWQNLIGNAVKFQRPGVAPRIDIDCRPAAQGDQWLITLADNGIGIGEEFADKVFVIFQRLHGRDAYAGTGIGLALVKKIVEYHGGNVWIDTTYTGGTRFCLTLPTADREAIAS